MTTTDRAVSLQLSRVHRVSGGDSRYSGDPKLGLGGAGQVLFAAIKVAMARCLEEHGLKSLAVADLAGIRPRALERMLSPSDSTHPITLDAAVSLLAPGVMPDEVRLEAVGQLADYWGVRMLVAEADLDADLFGLLLRAGRAMGELCRVWAEGVALNGSDGVSPLVAEAMLPEVARAEVVLGALHARLVAIASAAERADPETHLH